MRYLLSSVMMLFCLFILGCGGTPEMVEKPEEPTELTEEELDVEMELQNERTE